jgi:hypothetical protein
VIDAMPPERNVIDHVVDQMVLEGLRIIYEMNRN